MNEVAAQMGSSFSVDLTDLSQASSVWNGRMYTRLPDSIQTQVLQEIFEISFKQEFLLLDRYLYKLVPRREEGEIEDEFEACTREDRNLIIKEALFANGPPAFGHSDLHLRQDALNMFFRIMRGWSRSSSPMHSDTVRQGRGFIQCDFVESGS
ncbi:hypothetical protein BDP27DRAFT_1426562 [Rhodocollybia butyracea]|nr:hypothetical protein BDP27DRAFT_1426562 [Rhodocollybia butyracea]